MLLLLLLQEVLPFLWLAISTLLDVVELPEAFFQAFKDSNSSIACLSVPVACLKHCLNFSGSLPSLLQWAIKHTNWLASFPAQRSSFHFAFVVAFSIPEEGFFELPCLNFSFADFAKFFQIVGIFL